MSDVPSRGDLIEVLRWYADMGLDAVVDTTPHDRFAESTAAELPQRPSVSGHDNAVEPGPPKKPPLSQPAVRAKPAAAPLPADDATRAARALAAAAPDLQALQQALAAFEGCALRGTATNLVFGAGQETATIMVVGEAPGADEDRQGAPFVGAGGVLLDRMMKAIGLDRSALYLSNVLPWRPPGGRAPTPLETTICLPFIARQIELVAPRFLLCLGALPVQTLLGNKDSLLRAHGRWQDYPLPEGSARAMPMFHPVHLMRHPAHKKLAWNDLQTLKRAFG